MGTDSINKRIKVNIKKCLACYSCQLVCAVEHSGTGNVFDAIRQKKKAVSRIYIKKKGDKIVARYCQQCKNAPCISVCSEGAMGRLSEMGEVVLDIGKCTGCGECMTVCPFEAIRKVPDGKGVVKCDLCAGRLNEGLVPACVEACPTRAIELILIK